MEKLVMTKLVVIVFVFDKDGSELGTSVLFGQDQIRWPGIIESKIGYNNVTWETAVKTNLGLDLGLWKDRLVYRWIFL